MINLKNTCVLVRTKEENDKLLKEAEKQGFHWFGYSNCNPFYEQYFPDILKFCEEDHTVHSANISSIFTSYEASELLGTKEMTAREFAEWIANIYSSCGNRKCSECVLSKNNTKCDSSLCGIENWKDNIDEILEIVASGRTTVPSQEEKAIKNIEKLIQIPDHEIKITDEIKESLKLAVEKLKEVK